MHFSVILPFHRNLDQLRRCLAALRAAAHALPAGTTLREIIVVADGAPEDPQELARAAGATALAIEGPSGPAVARNRGAALASGDVLVFVDSDVVIHEQALARFAALFTAEPGLGAAFGAYDEEPGDAGFVSQAKNLAHSFIHQRSAQEAHTFWAGLGAVRAEVFARVGGFDERFTRPSVEDIDLGYRMKVAGVRVVLDPAIQGKHLKRWTLASAIVSDVRDRGITWTQLIHRYGGLRDDLNTSVKYRMCVVIAYGALACALAAPVWPGLLAGVALGLSALWLIDRPYYRFFASRRGIGFALVWFPAHVVHHLCNGASFAIGTALYAIQFWTGVALPGALPLTPWPTPSPEWLESRAGASSSFGSAVPAGGTANHNVGGGTVGTSALR